MSEQRVTWPLAAYGTIIRGDATTSEDQVAEACSEDMARRIVACVNALQGVKTEWLEEAAELGITDVSEGNLFSSRLKLEKFNDELLAMLERVTEAEFGFSASWPDENELRALISKVKGACQCKVTNLDGWCVECGKAVAS